AQGATLLEPGRIRHGGNGTTHIGCLASAAVADARRVVDLFNRAGLQAFFSERIEDRIWQKLLINIGINAVTALTAIPNGRVASQANARALAERAVAEALAVAERLGIQVGERVLERVLAVAEATGTNRSSMLQDLERKRATEIDAINGAIVRYGEDLGVPTPVNWTLTQLIKVIEHRQASEGDS
ncbi:MAG: 2-dehydropantoate 2-reductase, partial [Syntrophobacteraceae bacterium CG07_land_8_20_14_0_80_61_8]